MASRLVSVGRIHFLEGEESRGVARGGGVCDPPPHYHGFISDKNHVNFSFDFLDIDNVYF